jgi:DNA-binding NtrC family response regulator
MELVEKNKFRQDLYFRLKTVQVDLPPLRHRVEDISLLVERFALEFTRGNDIPYRGFVPDSIRVMKNYNWPGNVRELKNFVESILILQKGLRITMEMVEEKLGSFQQIRNDNLPVLVNQSSEQAERELMLRQLLLLRQDVNHIKDLIGGNNYPNTPPTNVSLFPPEENTRLRDHMHIDEEGQKLVQDDAIGDMHLEDLEREAIVRTLQYYNNNRRKAAKSLGMSERTLYRKINDYELGRKNKLPKSLNE